MNFFFSSVKKRENNCRQSNASVWSTTSTIRSGRGMWFMRWRMLIWWYGFIITFCSSSWSFRAWNRLLVYLSEGQSQRKTARWRCSENLSNVKLPLYDRPSHHDILSFSLAVPAPCFIGVSVSTLDWYSSMTGFYLWRGSSYCWWVMMSSKWNLW